ncbi:hypothetical protein M422DRAFT_176140 [Sphaerobolus stellatus SS14]|uniref:Unplaced genomic scaffold SPHSTscaffold_83, whole genome shotgun sequence n=1 Tax=Sphaerobolus stellatus (strain SS14) TaxID=990650 RepID=A0A0C9U6X3_SPHS4|nr:hypothetical protein M422DRAFT_176140 [Sphaerobolus stellatus SS14]
MSLLPANLWIGGERRSSSTGKTFDVINSVTQQVVTRAPAASSQDVIAAIEAAYKAQPAWEAVPWRAKRDLFIRASELLKTKYVQRVIDVTAAEVGALENWAKGDTFGAASYFLEAAMQATQLTGETQPSAVAPGGTVLIERRPFGTVFAIVPFNSPVLLTARGIACALACGNTVVLKSAELSPASNEIIVEVLHEAGLPKGVLNLLHMAREDAPKLVAEIIGHKAIRHVNFTGSDRVGRILAGEAAKYLKPCVFELGGKAPVIVLNDANVKEAARFIVSISMVHAGQVCMSTERVIVQSGVSKELIEAVTSLARNIRVATDSGNHIPALTSKEFVPKVLSLLQDAKDRGGEVLVGDLTAHGAHLKPHIILGVEPGWPLWEQESFGPVFVIKVVETEEEAVKMANETDYSLTAAIWTGNMAKGLTLARQIRSGYVQVNGPTFNREPGIQIRGLGGATGYGLFDVEHFTQKRILILNPDGITPPFLADL